jgi:hypothetical protein
MKGYGLAIAIVMSVALAGPTSVWAQATPCQFVLGFAALHTLIPSIVGDCVDNEQHNPDNGDALQHSTNGLLVWRKVDNFTAFTDGFHSWVLGPFGLQERLNTERFSWEANPTGLPIVAVGTSGIDGVVTLGPTTSVCRVDVPCSRPIAATVSVQDAGGRIIRQFTSGIDGRFHVDLPPGTYTLVPLPLRPGAVLPRGNPATVTVVTGGYTHVDLNYDTGIR